MKRISKYLSVLLIIVIIIGIYLIRKPKETELGRAPVNPPTTAVDSASPQKSMQESVAEREILAQRLLNVPIRFWGKVVDENGMPLSGVKIQYRIQVATGMFKGKRTLGSLISHADGSFDLTGLQGTSLAIEAFEKEGFRLLMPQRFGFGYSGGPEIHSPNPSSPIIFVMMSTQNTIDVSKVNGKIRLPWDGQPLRIDLGTGMASPQGELIVTAFRSAAAGQLRGFEWKIDLEIEGGYIQEEPNKESAPIAPESGYVSNWIYGSSADNKPWIGAFQGNIYYKKDGKYGRLNLRIYSDRPPDYPSMYLEHTLNLTGTRICE